MSVTYHDSDDETSATGGTDIDDLLTPMSEDVDELVAQQRTTYFMDGGNRFISVCLLLFFFLPSLCLRFSVLPLHWHATFLVTNIRHKQNDVADIPSVWRMAWR